MICYRCYLDKDDAGFAEIPGAGRYCAECCEDVARLSPDYPLWRLLPRKDLIDLVKGENLTILDCGCDTGYTMQALERLGHTVTGLDIHDNRIVSKHSRFWMKDLKGFLPFSVPGDIRPDVIVLGDVAEHLDHPGQVIEVLRGWLKREGRLILSAPNIGWIGAVLKIANQDFDRTDDGTFDRDHRQFFTMKSLIQLVESAGFHVEQSIYKQFDGTPPFPGKDGETHKFQYGNLTIEADRSLYDALNAYQLILVAKPANE